MPRVYNKRTDKNIPADAVYIGRPGPWGNPYFIGHSYGREEVIRLYRESVTAQTPAAEIFRTLIRNKLKGKDLICWCSPLPCHGDILLEIANAT